MTARGQRARREGPRGLRDSMSAQVRSPSRREAICMDNLRETNTPSVCQQRYYSTLSCQHLQFTDQHTQQLKNDMRLRINRRLKANQKTAMFIFPPGDVALQKLSPLYNSRLINPPYTSPNTYVIAPSRKQLRNPHLDNEIFRRATDQSVHRPVPGSHAQEHWEPCSSPGRQPKNSND